MEKTKGQKVMRPEYRQLNSDETADVAWIKDRAGDIWDHFDALGRRPDGFNGSRELSIAKTKLEEAVMWAVKHVTREEESI